MKKTLLTTITSIGLALSIPATSQAAPDPNLHIYLLLGQSNMQGAAHLPDQPISHPRVRVLQGENCQETSTRYGEWRDHFQPISRCHSGDRQGPNGSFGPIGLSPADTFAVTMADAAGPEVTIGLVGAAYGGAQIESFLTNCADFSSNEGKPNACYPPYGDVTGAPQSGGTTPMHQWVIDLGTKAQEAGVIKGIIFHHGESNAGDQNWLPRVRQYIDYVRTELNLDPNEVPFIAGELPHTGCCASQHNPLVRQIGDYVDNGHWVSAGPMADGTVLGDRSDSLHWSTESVIEMGKRYAAKMLEVGNFGPVDCGTEANVPVCCDISADPNDDGIGSQNDGQECVITENTRGWHPPNPDNVVVAINVGSTQDGLSYGDIWFDADSHFTGGTTNSTADSISGANGSSVFNSERYGDYSYQIPVDNGNYSVQLGMAEIYNTATGARSFDVTIENSKVIDRIDIYAEAGHDSLLLSDEFDVAVTDGNLSIDVVSVVDNGTLASIVVRTKGTVTSSSSSQVSSSSTSNSSSSAASNPPATAGALNSILLYLLFAGLVGIRLRRKA